MSPGDLRSSIPVQERPTASLRRSTPRGGDAVNAILLPNSRLQAFGRTRSSVVEERQRKPAHPVTARWSYSTAIALQSRSISSHKSPAQLYFSLRSSTSTGHHFQRLIPIIIILYRSFVRTPSQKSLSGQSFVRSTRMRLDSFITQD